MRDSLAADAQPLLPPVEILPPLPPAEARPPTPPVEVSPPVTEASAAAGTDAYNPGDWGIRVEDAEASEGLVCNPAAVPHWAKPSLIYGHILSAMRPHLLEGVQVVTPVAQKLYDNFDCDMSPEHLRRSLEFMVVQRSDMCAYLCRWLRERMAEPDADPRTILRELINVLWQMQKT